VTPSSSQVLLVEEYGFDAAFNYNDGPVADQLKMAAPDGIDVYFAQYNAIEPPTAPRNLVLAPAWSLTVRARQLRCGPSRCAGAIRT
jgi:hypothetical protein